MYAVFHEPRYYVDCSLRHIEWNSCVFAGVAKHTSLDTQVLGPQLLVAERGKIGFLNSSVTASVVGRSNGSLV